MTNPYDDTQELSDHMRDEGMLPMDEQEMTVTPWPMQEELDKLVASGFAKVDERGTSWWTNYWHNNGTPENAHTHYVWTIKGQYACWRYRNTTPMSWAEAIHEGKERHCKACGCDTARKKVWAQKGKRTVCMSCGHGKDWVL